MSTTAQVLLVVGVATWLALGLLGSGYGYAACMHSYPREMAARVRWSLTRAVYGLALFGPLNLWAVIAEDACKYGWLLPGLPKREETQ